MKTVTERISRVTAECMPAFDYLETMDLDFLGVELQALGVGEKIHYAGLV